MHSEVLLIIPAYNEEDNIARVVGTLESDYPQYDYVVVNDGSKDGTASICREHDFRFLDLPINLGLAGAFQAGLKYADKHGYDCAIQFDADGQHRPEYVAPMVAALADNDIVIGSRFVDAPKPKSMRMFGNNLIEAMIKLTTGMKISDPTSGMRAYNRRMIRELAYGPNLGPEPDTLAYLIRKKGARRCRGPSLHGRAHCGGELPEFQDLDIVYGAYGVVRSSHTVLQIR